MNHPEIDANTGEKTRKIIDKVYTIINKTKFIICDILFLSGGKNRMENKIYNTSKKKSIKLKI